MRYRYTGSYEKSRQTGLSNMRRLDRPATNWLADSILQAREGREGREHLVTRGEDNMSADSQGAGVVLQSEAGPFRPHCEVQP